MDDQHHEQHENPDAEHRPLRPYEYPESDVNEVLPPAPEQHLHAIPKQSSHKALWITLGLIVMLALGAGVYFLLIKSSPESNKASNTSGAASSNTNTGTSSTPQTEGPGANNDAAASAAALKSTKLNLEVTKPSGWSGSEDPASGELTLTSKATTYTTGGKSVQGVFVLKIRQGADTGSQAIIHNTHAVQDSESIAYTAPTANQYQYTNITVAAAATDPNFMMVTSSDVFKKGEAMARYAMNGDSYIIIGGFRPADKTGLASFDPVPLPDFFGSGEYTASLAAIKSLKIN